MVHEEATLHSSLSQATAIPPPGEGREGRSRWPRLIQEDRRGWLRFEATFSVDDLSGLFDLYQWKQSSQSSQRESLSMSGKSSLKAKSEWVCGSEAARILGVAGRRNVAKLVQNGLIRDRDLPGVQAKYLRADVEALAKKSTGSCG
jgi:hypothetical protein